MTFREMQTAHCAAHTEQEIDCVDCTIAQQNAACELSTAQKAKKFKAPRAKRSVTLSARPVATQTINHVAGDTPNGDPRGPFRRYTKIEKTSSETLVYFVCGHIGRFNPIFDYSLDPEHRCFECRNSACNTAVRTGGEVNPAPAPTPLQQPLTDGTEPFVAAPAHLSEATVAKGFLLAGNAYFTVRSQKTGTRYTFRVNRAKCSRCGKTDCQCWRHPNYFVSLLTGPDNEGDYTYLGMIRENIFRATRATGAQEQGKPFAAFRYVWAALAAGRYPAQVEIWHEGRCGRCGRKLTVPESIERGIGPECATKGGF